MMCEEDHDLDASDSCHAATTAASSRRDRQEQPKTEPPKRRNATGLFIDFFKTMFKIYKITSISSEAQIRRFKEYLLKLIIDF